MRSILPPELQGEAAALVSAGCEVIQINRKFFAKYLDDNMTSIIALKVSGDSILISEENGVVDAHINNVELCYQLGLMKMELIF